ncbi:hypothetical protein AB1N83_009518 [Pleurotus pulmonarius]
MSTGDPFMALPMTLGRTGSLLRQMSLSHLPSATDYVENPSSTPPYFEGGGAADLTESQPGSFAPPVTRSVCSGL